MAGYGLRSTGLVATTTAINEVQTLDLGDISTADTFKLTHNAVASGTITYSTDMSAAITAALEALTSIGTGNVTTTKTSTTVYVCTFGGTHAGENMGAITITNASGFTPTGVTESTSGRSQYLGTLSLGSRFAEVYGVYWGNFVNSGTNELVLTDAAGRVFYSIASVDTNPKVNVLIGQDGKDQSYNSAANVLNTFVEGPITVRVRNGGGTTSPATGSVELLLKNGLGTHYMERSTGTIQVNSSGAKTIDSFSLGETVARIIQCRIYGFDSSTDYAITDARGTNVFTKTGLDATTALDFAIGYDGTDQAGNAAADTIPGVFRGPLTIAITNGGTSTTGSIKFWVEG